MTTTTRDEETHPLATALQLGEVLGVATPSTFARDTVSQDGHIVLDNAKARRLLALARKTTDAWAVVPEEDAVEILGALSIAAQVCATVGDKTGSAHYGGLYGRYAQRHEA